MRIRHWTSSVAIALAISGCAGDRPAPAKKSPTAIAAIDIDWADPNLHVELPEGWTLDRCEGAPVTVCVTKDNAIAGTIRFQDLPSQGEEVTTSDEQVQAVLAVRIHTIYKELEADRQEQCGDRYRIKAATPTVITFAGKPGLKYAASGIVDGSTQERVVGYRMFRRPIETQIQVEASLPNACGASNQRSFSLENLQSFEPLLDRLVAGSELPPATKFVASPVPPSPSEGRP